MDLGIVMVLKDEELLLPQCLNAIKELTNKYSVVVDDRSKDKTEEILKELNIPYTYFTFRESFSEPVNKCIKQLDSEWILAIAADELLLQFDINEIRRVLSNTEDNDCYAFKRRDWRDLDMTQEWLGLYPDYQLRLFKNNDKIKFHGKVHESLIGYQKICWTDITIQHFALYKEKLNPDLLKQKRELYSKLGELGVRQSIEETTN